MIDLPKLSYYNKSKPVTSLKSIIMKLFGILIAIFTYVSIPNHLLGEYYSTSNRDFQVSFSSFDSLNVRFLGSWPFGPSEAVAIDSIRHLAFVGSGGGVFILDVSDSTNPIKISERIHTRDWIRSLYFDKNTQRLCIANYYAGFEIWNTADPHNPERLCIYHDIFPVLDISVRDSLVYVANSYTGLHIFNISDPMNPNEIGFCQISDINRAMTVNGSFAYIVTPGLSIIDISNPENPELLGFWNGGANDVCVIDTIAFIVGNYISNGYIGILNISDPKNPYLVNSYSLPCENPIGLTVQDSIVYVVNDSEGFMLVNISDLFNPFICGYIDLTARDISVSLPYAYVAASWNQGMRVINVANPSNPYQISQFNATHESRDVWVTWPYAYVADGSGGFRILDISNVQNPYEVSFCWIPHEVQSVFVVDTLAYITSHVENQGLRIINIKDSYNPVVIGQCALPGHTYALFVKDTFAYVTDTDWFWGHAGLRIINISDPSNPYQVNYYATNWDCNGIFVRDSLAYFTENDLHIVDISNPSNIKEVGYYDIPAYAHGVTIEGNVAYVTGNLSPNENLMLIDISDPENPVKISSLKTAGNYGTRDCFVHGSYAYLSDVDGGLRIIDVSSPSNPLEVGYYQTPTFLALNTFVSDSLIYVAAACLGLQVYQFFGTGVEEACQKDCFLPSSMRLNQNPVNGADIILQLNLHKEEDVEIALYNSIGQRVRSFELGRVTVGNHELRLEIRELTSGVYFLRRENSAGFESIKVLVIR
jgi:hypothetical protein